MSRLRGSLVLALKQGAVEAQVVPVASSEAMAVDVGPSRVAVHGTRFRVARTGEHAVIDLNEGAVSVGQAPRIGSTLGGLVTAPPTRSSRRRTRSARSTSHDPGDIRPPLLSTRLTTSSGPTRAGVAGGVDDPAGRCGRGRRLLHDRTPAHGRDPSGHQPVGLGRAERRRPQRPGQRFHRGPRCSPSFLYTDGVTIVVSTTLYLQLHDDGSVVSARFEPPVAPDVNACSAGVDRVARVSRMGESCRSRSR